MCNLVVGGCVCVQAAAAMMPKIMAVMVLDQREGTRIAAKFYDKSKFPEAKSRVSAVVVLNNKYTRTRADKM